MNLTELKTIRPELFINRAPWYIINQSIQFMQNDKVPLGYFGLKPKQCDNLEISESFLILDDKIALSINKQQDIGDNVYYHTYSNILLEIFPYHMNIHKNIKKIDNYLILGQCMAINLNSPEIRIFTPIIGKQ